MKYITILLFLFSLTSYCQTGTIKFVIEQDNGHFEILVNDTLLLKTYKDTLPVGTYTAKIWSPSYKQLDTSFIIKKNIETICFHQLKRTENYYNEVKNMVLRNKKKSVYVRLPIFLSVVAATSTIIYSASASKQLKATNLFIQDYPKLESLAQVQVFKSELLGMQNRFNKTRTRLYTSLTLSGLFAGVTIYGNHLLNKRYPYKRLNLKPSPFIDKMSFNYSINSFSLILSL